MESVRRTFRNQIYEDLRAVRTVIRQNEDAIYRLTYESQPFQTADLISKANEKVASAQIREQEFLKQISDIEAGLYDEKLSEEMKENAKEAKEKAIKKATKKITSLMKPAERKTNKEMKVERRKNFIERKSFATERDMAIDYERFLGSCERFPEGLREKIKKMPNNCGILFNGIWFMGMMPEKKPYNMVTIEEKRGSDFFVHYYTDTCHSLYRKEGRGRQTREIFVEKEDRRRIVA